MSKHKPAPIRKEDGGYEVVERNKGKRTPQGHSLGKHETKAGAERQLRAIEAHKHGSPAVEKKYSRRADGSYGMC